MRKKILRRLGAMLCALVFVFSFTSFTYAVEPTYRIGDVNKDLSENTGDACTILKYCVGLAMLDDVSLRLGDINNDGLVNSGDAALLLNRCTKTAVTSAPKFESYLFMESDLVKGIYGSDEWVADDWYRVICNDGGIYTPGEAIYTARSKADLAAFINPETCRFDGKFLEDVTKQYDESYFEDNALCFIVIADTSEAKYLDVPQYSRYADTLTIDVDMVHGEISNQILRHYIMIVEVSADACQNANVVADAAMLVLHK